MNEANPQEQDALRAELEQARAKLDGLVQDLRAVDGELESLAPERQQYRLLQEACGALQQLGDMGAAQLFWGEQGVRGEGEQHLRGAGEQHLHVARGRIDAFEKRLDEIEVRRQAVLEQLDLAQVDTEFLEEDLYEAREQEERRKQEWVVEREVGVLPERALVMPWTRGGEDDERFHRSLGATMLASLLLAVMMPMIELPLPDAWEPLEVPERLAKLIRNERALPPPPPPVREEVKPQETEPKPSEELVAEAAPKQTETPTPKKKSAEPKGILAFREKFSGLADDRPAARLGSKARVSNDGQAATGRPERSMVTTQAPGSSGGINLAALSRDTGGGGGGQIEGVQVARATSSIGTGNGGGQDRPLSNGPGLSRTDEEIQIVFDRHKSALYRLYNRELRRDPTLKGQMVLRMRIEPDGSVTLCTLQSTDMDAPQLAAHVVERVRTFDFGAKEVPPVTILYPIDFLPAT